MTHHYTMDSAIAVASQGVKIDADFLERATQVNAARWQGQDVTERPQGAVRELLNTLIEYRIPDSIEELQKQIHPNLPWAEDHFQERVSGEPLNTPPSSEWWPFKQAGHAEHVDESGQFSHTYPERMWPKHAGGYQANNFGAIRMGIRFRYGDLEDVVQQLKMDPSTRQAYLPIWFPEDTGATAGQRVPCTLGYHFLIRDRALQIAYFIRSCDYMRHFADDVYMASRLAQWVVERFNEDADRDEIIQVHKLYMHIVSFHIFEGDVPILQARHRQSGGQTFNFAAML